MKNIIEVVNKGTRFIEEIYNIMGDLGENSNIAGVELKLNGLLCDLMGDVDDVCALDFTSYESLIESCLEHEIDFWIRDMRKLIHNINTDELAKEVYEKPNLKLKLSMIVGFTAMVAVLMDDFCSDFNKEFKND